MNIILVFIITLISFLTCNASIYSDDHYSGTKLLLIVGCGRSGTTFMAQFLKASGLQVEHEAPGADGCVSWPMVVNMYNPFGWPADNVKFHHIFHQVRNPLDVITSFYINLPELNRHEWGFIRSQIPEINPDDPLLVQCAKYWYYWNLKAEYMAEWTYRIENLENVLPEFQSRLNVQFDQENLHRIPNTINHWTPIDYTFTWEDLQSTLPRDLFTDIEAMAKRYGYL